MLKNTRVERAMNLAFLITLFFMPIETAMTLRLGSLSPYKISFLVLIGLMLYTTFDQGPMVFMRSFIEGFKRYKWAIISIILYFAFDIISLAWTNDKTFSLKKYVTIGPMVIMAIYACYYYYGPRVERALRKERLRAMSLAMALVALFLSLLTWLTYLVFSRTYYILTLSLQSDYNQYILPILLGYICGIYYINTMEESWHRYGLFLGFSMIIMPIFYLSGSRRTMVLYLGVYAILAMAFMITNFTRKKGGFSIILSLVLIGFVLVGHKLVIDGFGYYSNHVYREMEEEAKKLGINAPSAQMDKSDGIIHGFRLEQDANWKESSLESGEAMGRRKALWTIAMNNIKSFSKKELLIGRGGSYQRDMYREESARELLFADGTPDMGQDFHPHSMLVLEMVNGGIIKLGLCLAFVLGIGIYDIILLVRKNYQEFVMVSAYGGVFLANQLIDSIYGILQNRLTWIFLFIVLGALGIGSRRKKIK